jgi:hypothetical protein
MSVTIKKAVFLSFGLVIVFAVSAFLVNKNLHDPKLFGPSLKFTEEKKDFGDVKQGPVLEGYFEFTNTGKLPLVIKNITTSCGCTGAMVDEKREFQPGEKGRIKFSFNTEGRMGKNEKSITIESNDLKNPRKTISFSCNIISP